MFCYFALVWCLMMLSTTCVLQVNEARLGRYSLSFAYLFFCKIFAASVCVDYLEMLCMILGSSGASVSHMPAGKSTAI